MAQCGEEIRIKDLNGAIALRVIVQCRDRYLLITQPGDWRNGFMVADWAAVLRELVSLTVPAKIPEKVRTAESSLGGMYASVSLTYPLSVKGLADVLGVDADAVRTQLADLAVETG